MLPLWHARAAQASQLEDTLNEGTRDLDVILIKTDAVFGSKTDVIRGIHTVTNLSIKEALELIDGAPSVILRSVSQAVADDAKVRLEAVGAIIEVRKTSFQMPIEDVFSYTIKGRGTVVTGRVERGASR
jgi:ribosomal protein L7/L12